LRGNNHEDFRKCDLLSGNPDEGTTLETQMKELHDEIKKLFQYIESNHRQISDHEDRIAVLKVHYTSLLNTALAYENFDKEDFESNLS
jgi:predicted  nucleic acid-binding Zn-ribbon protein